MLFEVRCEVSTSNDLGCHVMHLFWSAVVYQVLFFLLLTSFMVILVSFSGRSHKRELNLTFVIFSRSLH